MLSCSGMQHLLMLKYLTTQKTLGTVKLLNLIARINVMAMAMVCTLVGENRSSYDDDENDDI